MRGISLTRPLGIAAILLGWLELCIYLVPLVIAHLSQEREAMGYVFDLTIVPMLVFPGVLLIVFGFRLLKERTRRNIKGTVGAFAVLAAFRLAVTIAYMTPAPKVMCYFSSLVATLCVVPVYVLVSRFLMMKEGFIPVRGEFIGKGIVLIIAFEIGLSGFSYIDELAPIEPPLDLARLAPWILAWLVYKVSTRIIEDK